MKIGGILLEWYKKNKRDLPWRQTTDPYRIWLSEIILQQTRVEQGLPYYLRFTLSYPRVQDLAAASEDEVLKLWQGLGYYSRARNLHQAARDIMAHHKGVFPNHYRDLLDLKGVGPYTAAAIASMAYGERLAVVDGNVARVLARIFGVEEAVNTTRGKATIQSLATVLLEESPGEPGIHNQAVMEFGALQCLPGQPDCPDCPLENRCQARRSGREADLPIKKPKNKPVEKWLYFYLIGDGRQVLLEKRGSGDIWQGLYQFPVVQRDTPVPEEAMAGDILHELLASRFGTMPPGEIHITVLSPEIRHQLTHRSLRARFIHVKINSLPQPDSGNDRVLPVPLHELDSYPVPRLIDRYLQSISFRIFEV
jgi:A/G-specific adenine glycosylase